MKFLADCVICIMFFTAGAIRGLGDVEIASYVAAIAFVFLVLNHWMIAIENENLPS